MIFYNKIVEFSEVSREHVPKHEQSKCVQPVESKFNSPNEIRYSAPNKQEVIQKYRIPIYVHCNTP
jgi:hypothetical protein